MKKLPCYSTYILSKFCRKEDEDGKEKDIIGHCICGDCDGIRRIVSVYEMNKGAIEVKAAQAEIVDTIQSEAEKTAQTEIKSVVQEDKLTFSCGVSGCTQTEVHQHGLCGIDGCMQIGEHSHDICGVAGCTETEAHVHNGEYCYPHSEDDGHAYHNCGVLGCTEMKSHTHNSCGVSGCTEVESHTHNSCGVSGCTQTGEHSHERSGGSHHQSGHGSGHH